MTLTEAQWIGSSRSKWKCSIMFNLGKPFNSTIGSCRVFSIAFYFGPLLRGPAAGVFQDFSQFADFSHARPHAIYPLRQAPSAGPRAEPMQLQGHQFTIRALEVGSRGRMLEVIRAPRRRAGGQHELDNEEEVATMFIMMTWKPCSLAACVR